MPRDEVVLIGLVVSFASLVTAHLTLVFGLLSRAPRWRAPTALIVVPLAPFWGRRERMHVRTVAWVVSAIAYGVLLTLALR